MARVKIIKGCVADRKTLAAGDIVEISDNAARLLFGAGMATYTDSAEKDPDTLSAKKKVAKKKAPKPTEQTKSDHG